jgi:hypothetical protein
LDILDVRQRGASVSVPGSVPGALAVTFDELNAIAFPEAGADVTIVTFCDCPNDASAAFAANILRKRGWHARVLRWDYESSTKNESFG